jgi:hypothetical protein
MGDIGGVVRQDDITIVSVLAVAIDVSCSKADRGRGSRGLVIDDESALHVYSNSTWIGDAPGRGRHLQLAVQNREQSNRTVGVGSRTEDALGE